MSHTVASLSLSHKMIEMSGETRIPAQRGGYHFDVVFRGDVLEQAGKTILAHLRDVVNARNQYARAEQDTLPKPGDMFQHATISGAWKEEVFADGRNPRLLLVADGWSLSARDGSLVNGGTLAITQSNPSPLS